MCIPDTLQQNILTSTKGGCDIATFLAETMRGETLGVKVNHRLEAAKQLIKHGFQQDQPDINPPLPQDEDESAVQSPLSPGERVRVRGKEIAQPITHLDILNYQIAHLIRHETAEGHTIVNFLVDTMTGRDRPFTPRKFRIKPADRMAAARELLRRGFGDLGSRRKLSDTTDEANAYDTLHTDLAKRMREYSERGTDTIRFLLELMSDPDPDKEFTIHHRMYAAQELLRRGWDTNYDNIKPEHLKDYWQDKESTRLSIGQKKKQAGMSVYVDEYDIYDDVDYEAIAREIREDEDREANAKPLRFHETVPSSRHSRESRNPEDQQAVATMLPLPQGEGWGEGNEKSHSSPTSMSDNTPSTLTLPKSLPLSKSENEPSDPKAIIKEFKEAMDCKRRSDNVPRRRLDSLNAAVENRTACHLPIESIETLMEGDKDVHRGHVFACAQGVPGGGDEHQGGVPGVRAAPRHRAQDALAPRATGIPQEAPSPSPQA